MGRGKDHARPFLKWAGGKAQLLPTLLAMRPPRFERYAELFLGGGALFFALSARGLIREAILADINAELIDTYLAVRDCPECVLELLKGYPNEPSFYYTIRAALPQQLSLFERAARMIYLNKTGYNGLYRVNRRGVFNVPFGGARSTRYVDERVIRLASDALKRATLINASFEASAALLREGDWVYFDPPYIPVSRSARFVAYTPTLFQLDDHRRLRDLCQHLAERGVFVMISSSDCPQARAIYGSLSGFQALTTRARRAINAIPTKRGGVSELILVNYHPAESPDLPIPRRAASRGARSSVVARADNATSTTRATRCE